MFTRKWRTASPVEAIVNHEQEKLRKSRQDIEKQKDELASAKPTLPKSIRRMFEAAKSAIQTLSERTAASLGCMIGQKRRAKAEYRRFQVERGITREASRPDTAKAIWVFLGCWQAEGLGTAALMIADGKMDVMPGLAYGLTVAAINIATGVMAGFLPARYIAYKCDAPLQKPVDQLVRIGGGIAFMGFIAVMAVLNFSAARVRATGSHENIWDFSEVSFAATFSDYYAIAIMVAGALGGILAVYEGCTGLSDIIPGYTKVRREAEESTESAAEDMCNAALDSIEEIFAETSETIEAEHGDVKQEFEEYRKAVLTHNDRVRTHNNAVASAIDRVRAFQADDLVRRQVVSQKKCKPVAVDFDAFKSLRLEEIPLPELDASASENQPETPDWVMELQAVYEQAVTSIREAYSAFLADSPEFTLNNPHEGDGMN